MESRRRFSRVRRLPSGLRKWRAAAPRRCDVDAEQGTIRVECSVAEPPGSYLFGQLKSGRGKRAVVPAVIQPALAHHLATFTASQPHALVFTSPKCYRILNLNCCTLSTLATGVRRRPLRSLLSWYSPPGSRLRRR